MMAWGKAPFTGCVLDTIGSCELLVAICAIANFPALLAVHLLSPGLAPVYMS